ncbi:MAG: TolC family outer membrane protein [Candidatus Symbiodolus clandestinus]
MKKITLITLMLIPPFYPMPRSYADNLFQIYQQVMQNNPELREAAANQDKAAAELMHARGALLPHLTLQASHSRIRQEKRSPFHRIPQGIGRVSIADVDFPVYLPDKPEGGYSQNYQTSQTLDLILSQSLFELPKWYQFSVSQQGVDFQKLDYRHVQQQMMLRTVECYLQTLLALDTLDRLAVEKRAKSRKLHEVEQMTQVGVLPMTDYYKAKSDHDLVVAGEIKQRNQVVSQLEQLRELSGQTPEKLMGFNSKNFKPELPDGSMESWVRKGEQNNWELRGARLQQQIALRNVKGSQTMHLPTLVFQGKLEHQRNHQEELAKKRTVSGGLSLNLPLFFGGQTTAKVKEAQVSAVKASEALEKAQRRVVKEIREAYNGILEAISSSQAYQQAVSSAQRELEAMETSFKAGTVTLVEVMNARTNLFGAKRGLAEAQYSYISRHLKLKACVGTLTEQDLQGLEQRFTVTIPTDPKAVRGVVDEKDLVINRQNKALSTDFQLG